MPGIEAGDTVKELRSSPDRAMVKRPVFRLPVLRTVTVSGKVWTAGTSRLIVVFLFAGLLEPPQPVRTRANARLTTAGAFLRVLNPSPIPFENNNPAALRRGC